MNVIDAPKRARSCDEFWAREESGFRVVDWGVVFDGSR